jgi:hypothetical protein
VLALNGLAKVAMPSKLLVSSIILSAFLVWIPAPTLGEVQQHIVHHRRVHHHVHDRYYIRHRTKMQHAKIIGGTALKGASVGGLVGGPPGSAAGAAAGAAVGTAYDLKTRKVKAPQR